MTSKNWDVQKTELLIKEYERHPCLYNPSLREYKDVDKRKSALNAIAAKLNTTGEEVFEAFQRLQSQYNRERIQLLLGPQRSNTTDDSSQHSAPWIHFKSLNYINKFSKPNSENGHYQQNYNGEGEGGTNILNEKNIPSDETATAINLMGPQRNKRNRNKEQGNEVVNKTIIAFEEPEKQQESREDIFGKFVASELKNIKDEIRKNEIMSKISKLFFDEQTPSFPAIPVFLTVNTSHQLYQGKASVSSCLSNQNLAQTLSNQNLAQTLSNQNIAQTLSNQNLAQTLSNQNKGQTLSNQNNAQTLFNQNIAQTLSNQNKGQTLSNQSNAQILSNQNVAKTFKSEKSFSHNTSPYLAALDHMT